MQRHTCTLHFAATMDLNLNQDPKSPNYKQKQIVGALFLFRVSSCFTLLSAQLSTPNPILDSSTVPPILLPPICYSWTFDTALIDPHLSSSPLPLRSVPNTENSVRPSVRPSVGRRQTQLTLMYTSRIVYNGLDSEESQPRQQHTRGKKKGKKKKVVRLWME